MKKTWKTPELSRFGSVAQMTLSSAQENQGKCPGEEDDAECAPGGPEGCTPRGCGDNGVLS